MAAGKEISFLIGENILVGFAVTDIRYGRADKKTHQGFLEFRSTKQPNFKGNIIVRVELAFNDMYIIKVLDAANKKELIAEKDIFIDDLVDKLFEVLG